jgi:sigma-B regulation protein RsbU (phosphoserine phosphatase)
MSATAPQLPLFARIEFPPVRHHVDAAAFSRAARTFTGDFYYTHRDDDRLWFALGDVAGKGLPAAVFMAMIQEELEHRITLCAATRCDPASTMQRLHAFLKPILPHNRFATVVIGHLRNDGLLTIANGGHCAPVLARAGGAVETIGSTGPVAGLLESSRWASTTRQLAPGDALLLFSDGLLEARSVAGEELGDSCIARTFARAAAEVADAREIVALLLDAARRHAPEFDDDLTLLALRYV